MTTSNNAGSSLLAGQTAIVTGATRGIGRAIAEVLACHGAKIVVTSRHLEEAREVARDIERARGVGTLALATDVHVLEDAMHAVRQTLEWSQGRLDILVNNAGFPLVDEIWQTPLHGIPMDKVEAWFRAVYEVDLQGARFMTYAALPQLVKQKSGVLVYVSSTPALSGYHGTPYTEAKAGLLGLMRDVAREYGQYGIRANAVAPGNIQTDWYRRLTSAEKTALAQEARLGRWGTPDEVANAVLFLSSPLASYVTGQTLVVDGGAVIH